MKIVTNAQLNELCQQAALSPRRRTNLNIHAELNDPIQRLFVAATRESYFRPHRHSGKAETALVVRGRFDLLIFDEAGSLTHRLELGPQARDFAFELPEGAWHSWVALTDDATLFETKAGPYAPIPEADFAAWSPAECAPEAASFVEKMRNLKVNEKIG